MDSSSCPVELNGVHSPRSWLARSYYSVERVRACLNVQLRLYITPENYGTPVGSQETAYPAVKHYYKGGQTGGPRHVWMLSVIRNTVPGKWSLTDCV